MNKSVDSFATLCFSFNFIVDILTHIFFITLYNISLVCCRLKEVVTKNKSVCHWIYIINMFAWLQILRWLSINFKPARNITIVSWKIFQIKPPYIKMKMYLYKYFLCLWPIILGRTKHLSIHSTCIKIKSDLSVMYFNSLNIFSFLSQ